AATTPIALRDLLNGDENATALPSITRIRLTQHAQESSIDHRVHLALMCLAHIAFGDAHPDEKFPWLADVARIRSPADPPLTGGDRGEEHGGESKSALRSGSAFHVQQYLSQLASQRSLAIGGQG